MTNREFWERYGPQFEETDRRLLERIEYHRRRAEAQRVAQAQQQASD